MGLDITVYNKIKLYSGPDPKVFDINAFYVRKSDDFPGRADELQDGRYYEFGKECSFRAGSYGGYNVWRDTLARIAGYPAYQLENKGKKSHCVACWGGASGPFAELINFSDCEGVIGTRVSKKLAGDFREYHSQAKSLADKYFQQKYGEWREAFQMASDDGCVVFH